MSAYSDSNDAPNSPTQRSSLAPLSPYLNFDPSFLPAQPEYIFPEGASKQRGRFELAFSQIGAACILGASVGGSTGFYSGLKSTTLAGQTGKVMRTRMLNHIMKQGAATSNTLGVIALMYSGIGVILSWARGSDDELNTLIAATSTGMLYRSTGGARKCGVGGAIGLGLASMYCLWTSRDKLTNLQRQYAPATGDRW